MEEKRKQMIETILWMGKIKGNCEAYISADASKGNFGYMIFPDQTIIGVFDGIFEGWNFTIMYVPTDGKGNGCRCVSDAVTKVTWDVIMHMKEEGIKKAKEIGATLYTDAEEWKTKYVKNLVELGA